MAGKHPEEVLRPFGRVVMRLLHGEPLSREETRAAYLQIWRDEQPELQQGAFIAAHKAKGETLDELVGLAESHNDEWCRCFPYTVKAPEPHLGIVGVGMDTLKTFNVSSGAAVIAAACGVYVHKVGAPGMTGVSGSADAFMLWGVDAQAPLENAIRAVEQCRLGFSTPVTPYLKHLGIGRVLSQLRMGTSIHLAGPMGFHSGERHKIVGVPAPRYVPMIAEAMKTLGYTRALVPCGGSSELPERHLDELSNLGPTSVAELIDGRVETYTLSPSDLGVREARYADVASAATREENARMAARVLAGKDDGPGLDLLAINAAACLRLMGKVDDWRAGVEQAKQAVADGRALNQLRALIEHQNRDPAAGLAALDALIGR